MNNGEMIKKLYDNIIGVILEGFEEDDKIIVKEEYMKILQNRYSNLNISDCTKIYDKLYKLEYNEWKNLSLNMKKNILLKDENLEEIINITSKAFEYAKDRLKNNKFIPATLAEDNISKLEKLNELVKNHNKKLADWYISEGIMDLTYSTGKTDNTSMRIGHIK